MAHLTTRPVTDTDRAFLYALYASTRDDLALLDDVTRENILQMQWRVQQAQYAAAWPTAVDEVVLLRGEPAGHLMTAATDSELRLVDVSLLPNSRGQGIGAALILGVIDRAASLPVRLSVAAGNPAKRLYERLGFVTVGESETYLEMEWRSS